MSQPQFPLNLYDADSGELLALVDRGEGVRQKSWLEEISQWLQEAATSKGLGQSSRFREANYPAFLTGERLSSNPIGQPPVQDSFAGINVYRALQSSGVLGTGDGAITTFGDVAPTQPDQSHAAYGRAAGDAGVPTPVGATLPPFVTTQNAGPYVVANGDILKVIFNGVQYDIPLIGTGGAMTARQVADSISLGSPLVSVVTAAGGVRILGHQKGIVEFLRVVNDVTGLAVFGTGATAAGVYRRGAGGPFNLGVKTASGVRPQLRVLPKSVSIKTVIAGNALEVTDNGLGVLSGDNGLGQTATGTINYVTGAVHVVFSAAVGAAQTVTYSVRNLQPLDMTEPVRTHKSEAFAIDLK